MSEYQYYDFRAIDQALTKAEITALRSISTRAVITFDELYEPLRVGRPEGRSPQTSRKVL